MMRRNVLMLAFLLSLVACGEHSCEIYPIPSDEPVAPYSFGISFAPTVIGKDDRFKLIVCLKSFENPLTDITITISLPPEVKLLKGDQKWTGHLAAHSEECLDLDLLSKTDWQEWSAPINAHAEFIYKGKKVIEDENHSYEKFNKKRDAGKHL